MVLVSEEGGILLKSRVLGVTTEAYVLMTNSHRLTREVVVWHFSVGVKSVFLLLLHDLFDC